jgi:hypothetical protein
MILPSCDSNVTPIDKKQELTMSFVRVDKKDNRYEPVYLLTNNTDTTYTYTTFATRDSSNGKHTDIDYRWKSLINGKWEECPWIEDSYGSFIDTIYPGDILYLHFNEYSVLYDKNSTALIVYTSATPISKPDGYTLLMGDTIRIQ